MRKRLIKISVSLLAALVLSTIVSSCASKVDKTSRIKETTNAVLPGLFSVSSTKQIRFSQGNLQYQASTNTWRFANHQYDIIGDANRNVSDSYSGWIDLFGWGTGNNPTLVYTNDSIYGSYAEWGANTICNDRGKNNKWRTLTLDEWEYLISERDKDRLVQRIGIGRVNGLRGFILLPDSIVLPANCVFDPKIENIYSVQNWETLETAGAVFLPAAGCRYGSDVREVDSLAYYWSSTPFPSTNDAPDWRYNAYYTLLSMYGTYIGNHHRSNGYAVRLVQDIK